MSVSVSWDNPQQTALLYSFDEPWGWEDYDDAMRIGCQMMEASGQKVGVIVDLSHLHSLPRNAIKHLSTTARYKHPNQGTLVFVGATPFIQTIGTILVSLHPKRRRDVHSVKALAQARSILNKQPWIRGLLRHIYR